MLVSIAVPTHWVDRIAPKAVCTAVFSGLKKDGGAHPRTNAAR